VLEPTHLTHVGGLLTRPRSPTPQALSPREKLLLSLTEFTNHSPSCSHYITIRFPRERNALYGPKCRVPAIWGGDRMRTASPGGRELVIKECMRNSNATFLHWRGAQPSEPNREPMWVLVDRIQIAIEERRGTRGIGKEQEVEGLFTRFSRQNPQARRMKNSTA